MRYLMSGFVFCALVMAGCSDTADNGPISGVVGPADPMARVAALPFQSNLMWGITGVQWAGEPGSGVKSTFDGRCPCEAEALISGHGEGQATHAGTVTSTTSQCMNFVWGPTGPIAGTYSDGIALYQTASGSTYEIHFGIDGVSGVDEQTGECWWRDRWTMVDGTGLFEGATGAGEESGVAPDITSLFGGVPAPMVLEGTISFHPAGN